MCWRLYLASCEDSWRPEAHQQFLGQTLWHWRFRLAIIISVITVRNRGELLRLNRPYTGSLGKNASSGWSHAAVKVSPRSLRSKTTRPIHHPVTSHDGPRCRKRLWSNG